MRKKPANRATLFKPGQSGNPSGRPKDVWGLAAEARKHGPAALKVLVELMLDPNERGTTRAQAAQVLLDRGFGKPIQAHEHSGPAGAAVVLQVVTGVPRAPDDPPAA